MCNNVSTIIESVETTINVSESEQSHTGADSEHSEWDEVSDSSSDDFNFQGEYKAFQIRAELEDDSAWEINEVTRTRGSDKNCFQESQDNNISENETPEDPNKLCSKRPGELIRLKSEVSKLPSQKVIDKHNLTHLPHAKWCLHCVEGRAVTDQSLTVSKSERNKNNKCYFSNRFL